MTDLVLATDLSNDQREHLQAARSSAGSLLALLNDSLDFSKVDAGRMELDPVEFSVEETVNRPPARRCRYERQKSDCSCLASSRRTCRERWSAIRYGCTRYCST